MSMYSLVRSIYVGKTGRTFITSKDNMPNFRGRLYHLCLLHQGNPFYVSCSCAAKWPEELCIRQINSRLGALLDPLLKALNQSSV